ncbi:nitroreductase [Aureitalea sp. L0-47]|uniref:nitroreductase family protein n=1 Tax=Aureitalea sp. L0-47 TaxID=2816962 RepID=UPI00223894C2|nr:nitroreductase [Aureitalea sp. L0-47]MCW5518564.1 nitroreductase [Aureitalea sp. L0-47]
MIDIIKSRRAVFPAQYNSEEITEVELRAILESANWAPTHRRTEPWRFKVFREEAKLRLGAFLAEKYKETTAKYSEFKQKKIIDKSYQSACIIAICMQRDPEESVPEWEEIAATAMAVQNMWLTAHSLGIGAYWSSPSYMKFLGEHITLNDEERCLGFFYMGKFDGKLPDGERKTQIEEKTTWV